MTDILIEHLAKVNEVDNDGRIPLHLAAQEGHLAVVQSLVQHGSSVNKKSHDGKTALRAAAIEDHRDVVEYLLTVGADIDYIDADGRSTLYVLALENKHETATFLLEKGAKVDIVDLEGRTPLHVAAWQGHYELIDVLCRYGAEIDAVDNDNRSALQSASWQGHERVVQYLLDHGAHVDHTCNQGATALCIAAQEGHDPVVRVLLQYHANPNHADQFGRTPMKVALKSGHLNVIKLLEESGATVPTGCKSRSSSSASCASSETKPSVQASDTAILTVNSSVTVSSGGPAVLNGVHTINTPSESPDSTYDRRKSVLSNNSSKSSSYLTNSTNQSSLNSAMSYSQTQPTDSDCLTFTQQLQQCSMSRNRSRPISRLLSPVSEPHSPDQSPVLGSPSIRPDCLPLVSSENCAFNRSVKTSQATKKQIPTTINITMNPYNAEISDEEIWKVNPYHPNISLKASLQILEQQKRKTPDHTSKPFMGQSALEMRSPETRRKRNGIVTNPNHKAKGINSGHIEKLAQLESSQRSDNHSMTNGDSLRGKSKVPSMGTGYSLGTSHSGSSLTGSSHTGSSRGGSSNAGSSLEEKGPAVRPNGLPLKKETPL